MNILNKTKLAMAVTAFVGIASVSNVNAIQVNTNGSGRVLLAPLMMAAGDTSTKVVITNTDMDRAVKAHVALRSEKWSTETFDFVLYLSPGDVFRGQFVEENGSVLFQSNDDSIKCLDFIGATDEPPFANEAVCNDGNGMTTYAVPTARLQEAAEINPAKADDTAINIGHIQVTSVYSVTGTVTAAKIQPGDSETIDIVMGMPKRDLRRIFDMTMDSLLGANDCSTSGADGVECAKIDAVNNGILRGDVEMIFGNAPVNYVMTGLVDGDENNADGIECSATYCEKVIANPFYDHNSGQVMRLGDQMGINNNTNNLYNIERALSKAAYNGTYEQDDSYGTLLLTSLPTRYMHEDGQDYCSDIGNVTDLNTSHFTAPFTAGGSVPYNQHVMNNSEGKCLIEPEIIDVEHVTLAESGRSCDDLEGDWLESLNPDGTLLCTSINPVAPTITYKIDYEVQGIPLVCGNPDETAEWFGANPSGWFQMDMIEATPQGINCGFDGSPVTVTTIKAKNGVVVDFVPTSH